MSRGLTSKDNLNFIFKHVKNLYILKSPFLFFYLAFFHTYAQTTGQELESKNHLFCYLTLPLGRKQLIARVIDKEGYGITGGIRAEYDWHQSLAFNKIYSKQKQIISLESSKFL